MIATSTVPVRLVDLPAEFDEIGAEVTAAVERTLRMGVLVLGPEVVAFEQEFAAYCGADTAVGVDSGTSALELILRALGIGAGDEVVTAANSFIATSLAITMTGATPVFVDVDPGTRTIRAEAVQAALTRRTRAVLPVHLYGQPADMGPLLDLAAARGLPVVEDACQAHGARYRGRRVGSLGVAAAFSFYPSKNLGGAGDGGMVVTSDPALAAEVRRLRNYGQEVKHVSRRMGFNKRLDEIQAAVLRVKLPYLDAWNAARAAAAGEYLERLEKLTGIGLPAVGADRQHVWHLLVVDVPNRDAVRRRLAAQGIETGVHYPVPLPHQPVYAGMGYQPADFPVAEAAAASSLSLPMHPWVGGAVERVAEALAGAVGAERLSR
jgi:dTDP-4-amino-4,6-dideoxygalactose transaminase